MSMVIAIRADGNSDIGFGHLMRTKALARQLEKCGAEVIFFSRNPENIQDFKVEPLGNQSNRIDEDRAVEVILQQCRADMLIVDSYDFDQTRLDWLGGLDVISVYIDDMNLYEFNLDLIVNGNLFAPRLEYRGKARQLLGSQYLLLREEFSALSARKLNPQIHNALITFGAADMENVTPGLLEALFDYQHFAELDWHVVIGPVFKHAAEVEALAFGRDNVYIYHSPDINKLMNNCDIAISAAGSTTYELAACGVAAILIVIADNQLMLGEEVQRQGIGVSMGWYQELNKDFLFRSLDSLRENFEVRSKMTSIGQSLIDGKGAERLAGVLIRAIRGI